MHRARRYNLVVLLSLVFGFTSLGYAASEETDADLAQQACIVNKVTQVLLNFRFNEKQRKEYEAASREVKSARRNLQKKGFRSAALNEDIVSNHNTHYTKVIPDSAIDDQMRTGDCWDFAGCRVITDELLNNGIVGKKFHLSKNYVYFYSMLEKSDKILFRNIARVLPAGVVEKDIDSAFNVAGAVSDGGYFEYFNFLVSKYGIVPASAMKSTASFRDSSALDQELTYKLGAISKAMKEKYLSFEFAKDQKLLSERQVDELLKIREQGMGDVYKILASHLGPPPNKFTFTFKDGTKKVFTPKQFAKEVVKFNPKNHIVISSDPTLPYDKPYVIPGSRLGLDKPSDPDSANHFLNVQNERMLEMVKDAIDQGQAVWFGADVNQFVIQMDHENPRAAGIMHPKIFKTEKIYDFKDKTAFPLLTDSKEQRIAGTTVMDHAMVIVGYDLDESGKIIKLKVANPWGKKAGTKGYFHMYREWFEQFVSQIAISKKLLSKDERTLLKQPVVSLPGS